LLTFLAAFILIISNVEKKQTNSKFGFCPAPCKQTKAFKKDWNTEGTYSILIFSSRAWPNIFWFFVEIIATQNTNFLCQRWQRKKVKKPRVGPQKCFASHRIKKRLTCTMIKLYINSLCLSDSTNSWYYLVRLWLRKIHYRHSYCSVRICKHCLYVQSPQKSPKWEFCYCLKWQEETLLDLPHYLISNRPQSSYLHRLDVPNITVTPRHSCYL